MITITTHASTVADVLIPDVGVVIPLGGGSDSFSDREDFSVISLSSDLIALTSDDAYGAGAHTLIISDASGVIPSADVPAFLIALGASSVPGATTPIVATDIQTSGPGAGFAPLKRTFADGTSKTFAYFPDGLTIKTMTIERPGAVTEVWYAQINVEGVRTHWADTP